MADRMLDHILPDLPFARGDEAYPVDSGISRCSV